MLEKEETTKLRRTARCQVGPRSLQAHASIQTHSRGSSASPEIFSVRQGERGQLNLLSFFPLSFSVGLFFISPLKKANKQIEKKSKDVKKLSAASIDRSV